MNIKFFKDISINDQVGGKGLSLAKMKQNGFNIPDGFVITADLFNEFINQNNVKEKIYSLIKECNVNSQSEIEITSKNIIKLLNSCSIPIQVENQIIKNYSILDSKYVAVRSSATSEDGKEHAWAGTLETFLNVDKNNIIECVKKCWCSIFKPRALFYRIKNENKSDIAVAVVVQEMIQSEISGVAFSINPTNNEKNEIIIEAVLGLGETIVSGTVTPDTYIINKGRNEIIEKKIRVQKNKLVQVKNENEYVLVQNGSMQKLNDNMILELSSLVEKIERLYGLPVDVEWGIQNNKIYILQCRPITTVKENYLMEKIKKSGNWKFYVARKFNWFVENTEIYASMEKYQKEMLGFEIATQNYLCLNGDEYALNSDFKIISDKLDNYFEKDINFFEKFAKAEFEIVEKVKKFLKYMQNKKFGNLTFEELSKEFEKFNELYINSFIPGMTRPEDYLVDKLKKELIKLKYDNKNIDNIFLKIFTCPNYAPLSYSEEPLDLLKIAKKAKKNKEIGELIDVHIQKYAWIKGPVEFEDTVFTKEDFLRRLANLEDTDIDGKIENINSVRKNNDIEYEKILEEYKFTEKVKKIIKAIRDFIFLRTYTTEYSDHLFFEGRHTIFKEISKKTGISEQDLIMLDDKEILNILNNNGVMNENIRKILEDRKKGFAMIWINGSIETVFGNKSLELQAEVAKNYKITDNNEEKCANKNIISGNIANKGKVRGIARVLTTYKDIYKVRKGDIIVASMTTPDYVSAMEIAAGFITDEGGITCHAAILAREFNVPCIVGTVNATEEIEDGEIIELDAYNGKIYKL